MTTEATRPVLTIHNDDGSYTAHSVCSPTDFKVRAECLIPSRLVIPILFLPGVMGTRLRVKNFDNLPAWFPPENAWEKIVLAFSYLKKSASDRMTILDPDNTEVDDTGIAHPDDETATLLGDAPGQTDGERARWRGWGQLHADSYSRILAVLEKRLARIMAGGCDQDRDWHVAIGAWQEADQLGAQKPFAALDDTAFQEASRVFYPVHAVGYNWLRSNKESGLHLATQIDRILAHYNKGKKVAERVVIVTHSMGGLVARACQQEPGMAEKILGVVHGVMPAVGAPAFYKRMRAGFEGMEQVVLGRDAAEATAVLAHAPGPLELTPHKQYRRRSKDGIARHWLRTSHPRAGDRCDAEPASVELGDPADPHGSIYLRNEPDCWWRMVKEELIEPGKQKERAKAKREGKELEGDTNNSDFYDYQITMEKVREFQELIEDQYHPNTYAFYAEDSAHLTWNEVVWQGNAPLAGDPTTGELVADDLNGKVKVRFGEQTCSFEIDDPRGHGDGTVPAESGTAPAPHVVQIFKHEGRAKGHTSYDHQNAYSADIVQATTLYAITRIVTQSDWLKANRDKA